MDNCVTMLCWFLPCISVNQPWVCVSAPSGASPHPSTLSQSAGLALPDSHSRFTPAARFPFAGAHVSLPTCPPSPSPPMSTGLFAVSASPLLPCK